MHIKFSQSGVPITLSYSGNDTFLATETAFTLISIAHTRLGTDINLTEGEEFINYAVDYYKGEGGKNLTVQLTDSNGNVLANKTVLNSYNGKILERTTDANGFATVQIN